MDQDVLPVEKLEVSGSILFMETCIWHWNNLDIRFIGLENDVDSTRFIDFEMDLEDLFVDFIILNYSYVPTYNGGMLLILPFKLSFLQGVAFCLCCLQ